VLKGRKAGGVLAAGYGNPMGVVVDGGAD